ncbi:uncharacterized protein LOC117644765, partial [Thrips palmi]|uniref:Uncharacterized protein LOC117644765 n=1 Tax=Thrips palmi TaxID=161013 RepID=A0A6P8YT46_THRPL
MVAHRALRFVLVALLLGRIHGHGPEEPHASGQQEACVGEQQCLSECTAPTAVLAVPEEVVLVLGNSGSGKSALAKLLSRNDGDMVAVQDNNNYLIEGDGIGSSIASVTSVPELYHDNETLTDYFDCPGFEDTRGTCTEVTTTYYMKDIARHARRVKVLLLTPHFAVRKGQDRGDFVTMLKHAATVLQNPAKLQQSLALVVTKMEAPMMKVRGRYVRVPDVEVKKAVAAFLSTQVRPFLAAMAEDAGVEPEERVVFANALKLVDILLGDGKGDQGRIGLFHAPDEEGAMDDIQVMRDGRAALLDLVLHRMRYADVQQDDFGFSVSARTKVFALERARRLNADVVAALAEISATAKKQSDEAYDPSDIRATQERYAELEEKAAGVAARVKNSTDVQDFCQRAAEDFDDKVADKCRLLDVLQVVSGQPLVDKAVLASTWAAPLDGVTAYVKGKKAWYSLLLSLYPRLNSYRVQSQRQKVRQAVLDKSAGFALVPGFPTQAELASMAALWQNQSVPRSELDALLSRAGRGPEARCLPDGVVVVEGESLLLSEAVSVARSSCGWPKLLEVHALNTFFVDDSVRLPGVLLAVVAPRWEILGSPSIYLDGEPGGAPGRAAWGAASGGGLFMAVGLEFIGGKVLVSARGGAGGAGQD